MRARLRRWVIFCAVAAAGVPAAATAPLCGKGADAQPRPAPETLAPALRRLFDLEEDFPRERAFYRCDLGRILLCVDGANRSCARADKAWSSPAATRWCEQSPPAPLVPAAVVGHDTVFRWRCLGRVARPGEAIAPLDGQGYFKANWKRLR
ncbi:MAG TPA: hypothetical protein VIF40_05960 [Methylosinus sp.]|jgi:hypothetical protein|uniref:hypothetical protein n=1 Tax=Methylosinus sp. TaxID=427 RepID=UPI002F925C68